MVACPTYEAFAGCARALDMTQDAVYTFLKAFFLEVADLFPDTIINFCGDELQFEWQVRGKVLVWCVCMGGLEVRAC